MIKELCALRSKLYAYRIDDDSKKKKTAKGTKKCVVRHRIIYKNYADCLFNDIIIRKSQQRFKSYDHEMYTEEVNKIVSNSNDDKTLQPFDGIETYPHRTT